jgi:UDP-glucose 4-epimerase
MTAGRILLTGASLDLLRGEEALCSHGRQVRDFLYVKDAASALVALSGSGVTGPVNVASGRPRRLAEVARMSGDVLGREVVGRSPAHEMAGALRETVDWWRSRV